MKVAVLGAGSWGTALASVLSDNGHAVTLWARKTAVTQEINASHTNQTYFPQATLSLTLRATTDLTAATDGAGLVLYAVPSRAVQAVAEACSPVTPASAVVAHAIKGFDLPTLRRVSEVLGDAHPAQRDRIGVVGGPSHAEEVILRLPTALVAAADNRQTAGLLQDALMNRYLRVYTQSDVVGVEMGGSLKNIIALGVGIVDGLGFGDNAKAAVMTRGLAEIARLGERMGAVPLTFSGLTGVGDLIATCTSRHSRNLRAGRLIGQGTRVPDVEAVIGMVVEGIPAVDAAIALASRHEVDMPITQALHEVLHGGLRPEEAVEQLMGRDKRHEAEAEELSHLW